LLRRYFLNLTFWTVRVWSLALPMSKTTFVSLHFRSRSAERGFLGLCACVHFGLMIYTFLKKNFLLVHALPCVRVADCGAAAALFCCACFCLLYFSLQVHKVVTPSIVLSTCSDADEVFGRNESGLPFVAVFRSDCRVWHPEFNKVRMRRRQRLLHAFVFIFFSTLSEFSTFGACTAGITKQ
jgi:hypothetical protein